MEQVNKTDYLLPVPSYSVGLKIDYKVLLNLIYISNFNDDGEDRYIYINKINECMEEIMFNCDIRQKKTIRSKIREMVKSEILEEIQSEYDESIFAYRIYTKDTSVLLENGNGYVLIKQSKILELCRTLSSNEIKIYIAIAKHFTHKRMPKAISRDTIAAETKLSVRTISRALKVLQEQGYIELKTSLDNNAYTIKLID